MVPQLASQKLLFTKQSVEPFLRSVSHCLPRNTPLVVQVLTESMQIMSLLVVLIAILSVASGDKIYVGRKEEPKVDWNTAADRCKCWGGRLATFSNGAEYQKMKNAVNQFDYSAWIGLKSNDNGKSWQFTEGVEPQSNYCPKYVDQTSDMTKPVALNARPHCLCFSFVYFARSL